MNDWGKREYESRIADISAAKRGEMTLDNAKRLAEGRRRAAGLTMNQAAEKVSEHTRSLRYAALAAGNNK